MNLLWISWRSKNLKMEVGHRFFDRNLQLWFYSTVVQFTSWHLFIIRTFSCPPRAVFQSPKDLCTTLLIHNPHFLVLFAWAISMTCHRLRSHQKFQYVTRIFSPSLWAESWTLQSSFYLTLLHLKLLMAWCVPQLKDHNCLHTC